jgi:hypothetical protein
MKSRLALFLCMSIASVVVSADTIRGRELARCAGTMGVAATWYQADKKLSNGLLDYSSRMRAVSRMDLGSREEQDEIEAREVNRWVERMTRSDGQKDIQNRNVESLDKEVDFCYNYYRKSVLKK